MRSRRRSRKRRFPLRWILGVLVVGVVLNIALALRPSALDARVQAALERSFAVPVAYDSVKLVWPGWVELEGFRIGGASAGARDLASIRSVRLVPEIWPLVRGQFRLGEIVLAGAELRLERDGSGRWNWADAVRALPAKDPAAMPRVRLEGSRLVLGDSSGLARRTVELDAATFRLDPDAASAGETSIRRASFESAAHLPFALALALEGDLALGEETGARGSIHAHFSRVDLADEGLLELLPAPICELSGSQRVGGYADVDLELAFGPGGIELRHGELALAGGRAMTPLGVGGLRGLEGRAILRGGELRVTIAGHWGDGKATAEIVANLRKDGFEVESWEAHAAVSGLSIRKPLPEGFHPALATTLEKLGLEGMVHCEIDMPRTTAWPIGAEELVEHLTAKLEVTKATILPTWFPYPLAAERITGTIEGGAIIIDPGVEIAAGRGRVAVTRGIFEPKRSGLIDLELAASDVTLDLALLHALPERSRPLWDRFDLAGRGSATVWIRRARLAESPRENGDHVDEHSEFPRITVDALVSDGRLRYRDFPYAVEAVKGRVRFDTETRSITFADFAGRHGEAPIEFSGEVEYDEGAFDLRFASPDLPVDDDLLAALPDSHRRLLREFGFHGRVDAATRIARAGRGPDAERTLAIAADVREASLEHRLFPYPVPLAGGRLEIDGGSVVRLSGLRTPEGYAPKTSFSGSFTVDPRRPVLDFELALEDFRIDDRFKGALPASLRRIVVATGLAGTFQGDFAGHLEIDPEESRRSVLKFEARDIRTRDAGVDFGLKVSGMRAVGAFSGTTGPDDRHTFEGDLYLQEARFNRLDLQGGLVHFSYGDLHPLVRGIIKRTENLPPDSYQLPREIRDDLLSRPVERLLQASVTSESFYGGQANGFVYIDTREGEDFGGHFIGRNIEVARASADVFGHSGEGVKGDATGEVRFGGKTGDWHTLEGEGRGSIRDANLAPVPLFHGLLELLNLGTKGTVFRELALPYTIRDGRFRSSAIEIASGVVTLRGRGTLDFDGELDLSLEPEFIPVSLPVIDSILGLFKRVFSQVHIEGHLTRPRVSFRVVGAEIPISSGSSREKASGTE